MEVYLDNVCWIIVKAIPRYGSVNTEMQEKYIEDGNNNITKK